MCRSNYTNLVVSVVMLTTLYRKYGQQIGEEGKYYVVVTSLTFDFLQTTSLTGYNVVPNAREVKN